MTRFRPAQRDVQPKRRTHGDATHDRTVHFEMIEEGPQVIAKCSKTKLRRISHRFRPSVGTGIEREQPDPFGGANKPNG